MWVYHTKCIKRGGGGISQQDNGTCSNFGYRRCTYIKIRLMSHILEDMLTESEKIINLLVPLLTKTLNMLNSTQLCDFRSRNYHFPTLFPEFPWVQHKNSLFAGLFQFLQVHV